MLIPGGYVAQAVVLRVWVAKLGRGVGGGSRNDYQDAAYEVNFKYIYINTCGRLSIVSFCVIKSLRSFMNMDMVATSGDSVGCRSLATLFCLSLLHMA